MRTLVATLLLISASTASAIEVFLHQTGPAPGVPVLDAYPDGLYPDPNVVPPNPGIIEYTDPVTGQGVSVSGQFVGQISGVVTVDPPPTYPLLAEVLSYETLTGQPTLNQHQALELLDQGPNKNLQIQDFTAFGIPKILGGLLDTPNEAQGAVSLLFDYNVSTFGLEMIGANTEFGNPSVGDPGFVYFQFFRADGQLIGDKTVRAYDGPLWFQSLDAPFRGMSITTTDYQGLGYINFRFEPAAVPIPSVLALMAIGLGITGFTRRRRLPASAWR